MPRERTPTVVLKAEGKLDRGAVNAGRFAKQGRSNEPLPVEPISAEPPTHLHLDDQQIALWKRVLEIMPEGVAGSCDEIALHSLVVLWSRLIIGTLATAEWSQLRGLMSSFGMTPAARSKVLGSGPKVGDEDEEHMQEF